MTISDYHTEWELRPTLQVLQHCDNLLATAVTICLQLLFRYDPCNYKSSCNDLQDQILSKAPLI